jgi:hypothetical protein
MVSGIGRLLKNSNKSSRKKHTPGLARPSTRAALVPTAERYYKPTSGVTAIELPRTIYALLSSYITPRALRPVSPE